MQVPERLALIGGSILLSSTLIFTLKSQASSIIPHVSHSISGVFDHIGDAQYDSEFGNGYRKAQQNGWTIGHWGSAKYYIDDNEDLHISQGKVQGALSDVLGNDLASRLRTVNFDQSFQVPNDCGNLLGGLPNVEAIRGINNTDATNVNSISWMFQSDTSLRSLDLSNWDPHLGSAGDPILNDHNLTSINVSKLNTSGAYGYINMGGMFNGNHFDQITIGKGFNMWGGQGLNGNWRAPDGHTYEYPGGDHPGTWYRTSDHS